MAQITVIINGRSYRMACEDGQEDHLQALAERLDQMVKQLRASFGEIGDQRLTVMAGVMALDEHAEMKAELDKMRADVERLTEAAAKAEQQRIATEHMLAVQIEDTARIIHDLAAQMSE